MPGDGGKLIICNKEYTCIESSRENETATFMSAQFLNFELICGQTKPSTGNDKTKGSMFMLALKDNPKESVHQIRRKQVFVKYKDHQFMRALGS